MRKALCLIIILNAFLVGQTVFHPAVMPGISQETVAASNDLQIIVAGQRANKGPLGGYLGINADGTVTVRTTMPGGVPAGTSGAKVVQDQKWVQNVVAYGADFSGTLDSTAAFQALFTRLQSDGQGTFYCPAGRYLISSPLVYTGVSGGSLRIIGDGGGESSGCVLVWAGSSSATVLSILGAKNVLVQDISIIHDSTHNFLHGINYNVSSTGAQIAEVRTERILIRGGVGVNSSPISIGQNGSYPVDDMYFKDIWLDGENTATNGVNLQGSGNTKNFYFTGGYIIQNTRYGIYDEGPGGTFVVENMGMGLNTLGDVYAAFSAVTLKGIESENSGALLISSNTNTSDNETTILGCDWESAISTTGQVINAQGALTLIGNRFTNYYKGNPLRVIVPDNSLNSIYPNRITSIGNYYGYASGPYAPIYTGSGVQVLNQNTSVAVSINDFGGPAGSLVHLKGVMNTETLLSQVFKYSSMYPIASSGAMQLPNNIPAPCWRNAANKGDDCLGVNTSDQLSWSGPQGSGLVIPFYDASGNLSVPAYLSSPFGGFGPYGNSLLYSQFDSGNTAWTTYGSPTVTANATDMPDPLGTYTAEKFISTSLSSLQQQTTSLGTGTFTISFWMRGAAGGEVVRFGISNQLSTGVTLTTSWQHYSYTATLTSGSPLAYFTDPSVGSTIYIWGAQLTKTANPILYTHTTTNTVSLNVGLVSIGSPVSSSMPATAVQTNQSNTFGSGLQDFSGASLKQPSSYTARSYTITNPSSSGTLALTSQLTLFPSMLCRNTTTQTVSGTTAATVLFSCKIPAGTLASNSVVNASAHAASSSTGTCTYAWALGTTPSGQTAVINSSAVASGRDMQFDMTVVMQNSTAREYAGSWWITQPSQYSSGNMSASINTASSDLYLNFIATNSASGANDKCLLQIALVQLTQ